MRLKAVLVCLLSGSAAAIVACGDDGGARKLPDAAPTDGDIDGPNPQMARLTIMRDGAGVAGVDVFFQNADSSLIGKVTTNASGVAEAEVMPGAFVTVANPFPTQAQREEDVQTFAGVKPGDSLRLVLDEREVLTNVNLLVNLDPNASEYRLFSTCIDTERTKGPFYLSIGSGALDRAQGSPDLLNCGATADFLVESRNGSGSSVGWVFKDNVPVAANASLDFSDPYLAAAEANVTYTNVPSTVGFLNLFHVITTSDGAIWNRSGGGSGSSITWNFERPAPAASTQVFLATPNARQYSEQTVIDWKPIADAPTFSLADTLLRELTAAPAWNTATHTATWTEAATGGAPDFAIASVRAFRDDVSMQTWRWKLVGVPVGASLVYPTLPPEIAKYNPIATDSTSVPDLTTAKVPGGYDAVRGSVLAVDSPTTLVVGATGRIVIQNYTQDLR